MQYPKSWGDIQKGDVIRIDLFSSAKEVLDIQLRDGAMLEVTLAGDEKPTTRWFSRTHPVLLVYRPLPEGKTEAGMRDVVRAHALHVAQVLDDFGKNSIQEHLTDPDRVIAELRDAIEAYELGKPLEPDPMIPVGRVPLIPPTQKP